MERWYLVRTKAGKERAVCGQLNHSAADVLLPLSRIEVFRGGRMRESILPLFPCYLFAQFDLAVAYKLVSYMNGVREIVRFGGAPAVICAQLITSLKRRCAEGPIELPRRTFVHNERVMIVGGPLRSLEGVFERYMSGAERVAVLLSVIGKTRVLVPSDMVAPVD